MRSPSCAKTTAISHLRDQVTNIAQAKHAAAHRMSELETKLAAEYFELAAKAKALSDLRAEAESLSRFKDASMAELQSKLLMEQ